MSNLVFPALPGLMYPVTKTPTWRNKVQEASSGREVRVGFWSYPRWKYSLGIELMRDYSVGSFPLGEVDTLMGFFNTHGGSFDDWLFDDPDDNFVTDQSIGTGNGTNKLFQLVRSLGGYNEPVYNWKAAPAPILKLNGVTKTLTTDYSISATGLVTFVTAPANGVAVTWTGGYYWRCRFMDDAVDFEKFAKQMWQAGKIEFMSVKQ